jgi:hypothetical protein
MSTMTTQVSVAPTGPALRTAGRAGIAFAIAYVITFVLNTAISTLSPTFSIEYPTPAQMQESQWYGALFALLFTLVGLLAVVALGGVARLLDDAGSTLAPATRATIAAVGTGFFFFGAGPVTQHGFVNEYIAGAGASPETQSTVVQSLYVLAQAGPVLVSYAAAAFFAVTAIAGRRSLPRPLVVIHAIIAIMIPAVTFAFAFAGGLVLLIPYLAGTGIWLLRRAARA